jgi:hypothetical protein
MKMVTWLSTLWDKLITAFVRLPETPGQHTSTLSGLTTSAKSSSPAEPSLEIESYHTEQFSWAKIEQIASMRFDKGLNADTVYLSMDLYVQLLNQFSTDIAMVKAMYINPASNSYLKLRMSACDVQIIPVNGITQFCLVGVKGDYERLVQANIDREFEALFLAN